MTGTMRLDRVSFGYGTSPVIEDITAAIRKGELTVLLGKNGSGKSTLLRVMAGLLEPGEGSVTVMGRDLHGISLRERAGIIGYLPQAHRPVFPFSVEDVVLTGRAGYVKLMPGREDLEKVLEVLERIGIMHLRKRPFTELSGGEQQLVMIARVLAQSPKIILLDEPTSHLDLFNQARFLSLVKQFLADGLTVVVVLHDPNIAFLHGDSFIFLKDGRMKSVKDAREPWDEEFLRSVYDAEVRSIPYGNRAIVVPTPGPG